MHGDSLFREPLMPRAAMDRYTQERFLLDTQADRRAPAKTSTAGWLRAVLTRAIRP